MEQDQSRMQELSQSLQKVQDDLQNAISSRQTLASQQSENLAVQKEFKQLPSTSDESSLPVYRSIGPILLKQDPTEARSTVDSRLDYIGKQIADAENKIKELQTATEKIRGDMMGLQQKMQMQMAQAQSAG